jgi:RNase P subunit RPR2
MRVRYFAVVLSVRLRIRLHTVGKLDVLRVTCSGCERAGRYRLDRLIKDRGRDVKIMR